MAQYHYGLTSNLSKAEFTRRKRFLERLIAKLESRLENAPEGSLVVNRKTRTSVPGFYRVSQKGAERVYLGKSHSDTIARLAQKEYDQKALRTARKELVAINKILKYCDMAKVEDVLGSCQEEKKKFITPAIESDEAFRIRWLSQKFVQKQKNEGDKLYSTERGDLVQSKSEGIQADYLFHHNYAYLYEKRVKLIDHGRVTYRYPDFTILDPVTRQEVIFEHFGMVDQDHYFRNSFIDKLRLYLENGYVIGENLLFTFETQEHPFTIDQFARVLEARFGKGKKE
ncbi:MAG: hypothetical protein IJ051_04505 [Clostridia bacterium]|nr:hypothetical protein [Clostridia bacterium]